jgi:hypothetical protein
MLPAVTSAAPTPAAPTPALATVSAAVFIPRSSTMLPPVATAPKNIALVDDWVVLTGLVAADSVLLLGPLQGRKFYYLHDIAALTRVIEVSLDRKRIVRMGFVRRYMKMVKEILI